MTEPNVTFAFGCKIDFARFHACLIFENIARTSRLVRVVISHPGTNSWITFGNIFTTGEKVKRIRLPVLQIFHLPCILFLCHPRDSCAGFMRTTRTNNAVKCNYFARPLSTFSPRGWIVNANNASIVCGIFYHPSFLSVWRNLSRFYRSLDSFSFLFFFF